MVMCGIRERELQLESADMETSFQSNKNIILFQALTYLIQILTREKCLMGF